MRTIHKFAVQPGLFDLYLPRGAKVIDVQTQHGQPQMWILLNTDNDREKRIFVTFPTGNEIPENLNLEPIRTFQVENGHLVFHLFEVMEQ